MKGTVRKALFSAAALAACGALALAGAMALAEATMPPYDQRVGDSNYTEKITGRYLLEQSAARPDSLIIFGSSELRTTDIPTHPANFFAGKRAGFQVDLVGRGSCQSIIHAIQIAASGNSLAGKKVVLITSPQSYVPGGIAPDLFAANFSPQQYLALLDDPELSREVKTAISRRVAELLEEYAATPGAAPIDPAVRLLAEDMAEPGPLTGLVRRALAPYYAVSRGLYRVRDLAASGKLLRSLPEPSGEAAPAAGIDWQREEQAALAAAREMSANNDFGMLDDYYTTYIGARLERQKDRDRGLSYSVSKEYGDLALLFTVCREKGIEPLFVHVPLHGEWSDYTGFDSVRRQQYYENVRSLAEEYSIRLLDLTGGEYDPYFMCDVMHLGWKGWLEFDKAIIDYYHQG